MKKLIELTKKENKYIVLFDKKELFKFTTEEEIDEEESVKVNLSDLVLFLHGEIKEVKFEPLRFKYTYEIFLTTKDEMEIIPNVVIDSIEFCCPVIIKMEGEGPQISQSIKFKKA